MVKSNFIPTNLGTKVFGWHCRELQTWAIGHSRKKVFFFSSFLRWKVRKLILNLLFFKYMYIKLEIFVSSFLAVAHKFSNAIFSFSVQNFFHFHYSFFNTWGIWKYIVSFPNISVFSNYSSVLISNLLLQWSETHLTIPIF